MLSALVHLPWSSGSRIHPRWDFIYRYLSQNYSRSMSLALPSRSSSHSQHFPVVQDVRPDIRRDPHVFEDQLDDYTVVNREHVPPPPSTLSLIDASLPKSLPQPSLGDNIFEDTFDSDYTSLTQTGITQTPPSLSATLRTFVSDGLYDEAYLVLQEARNLNLPVDYSHLYQAAAQAALSISDSQERLSKFMHWFSLLPPRHLADIPRKFIGVRRAIFHTVPTDVSLIIQATLLFASKGYAELVLADAVPFIAAYTLPDTTRKFILDFETSHRAYMESFYPETAARSTSEVTSMVRNAAVRALANWGNIEDALTLLPDPNDNTFALSYGTYTFLLAKIQDAYASAYEHVPRIRVLRHEKSSYTFTPRIIRFGKRRSPMALLFSAELNPKSTEYLGSYTAKLLRRILVDMDSGLNPPIPTILEFLQLYVGSGRTHTVGTLRFFALSFDPAVALHFLLAEMLYYQTEGLDDLVIQLYAQHFYIAGVPQDITMSHFWDIEHERLERRAHNLLASHPAYDIFYKYREQARAILLRNKRLPVQDRVPSNSFNDQRYRTKLMPNHAHNDLIWQCLVARTNDDAKVEWLYTKLLEISSGQKSDSAPDSEIPPFVTTFPSLIPSVKRGVGTEAFTPFLQRLIPVSSPTRGLQFLSEMMMNGIVPPIQHFTQIAGHYARLGDLRSAFLIIDNIEAQHLLEQGPQPLTKEYQNPHNQLPRPDLAFYTAILRGFIISKQISAAKDVRQRLFNRFIYVAGDDHTLDRALDNLADLEHAVKGQGDMRY